MAIISGGGTGIGAATARLFAAEGAKVVVTGRRPEPIEAVATEIGGLAVAGRRDRPGARAPRRWPPRVGTFGGLDVVVANAGVGFGGTAGDVNDERWQRDARREPHRRRCCLARAAMPAMLERGGGSIVLVVERQRARRGTDERRLRHLEGRPDRRSRDRSRSTTARRASARTRSARAGCVTPMGDEAMDELAAARGVDREEAYRLATDATSRSVGPADARGDRGVLPVPGERRVVVS